MAREIDPDQLMALDEVNRGRLQGYWDLLGEEARYPLGTQDVARLIRVADYDVDPDMLVSWVTQKAIPSPEREHGKLAWSPTHIVAAVQAAEARRRWLPFSQIHAHKFTMPEKIEQLCQREGGEAFTDLDDFDVERLLALTIEMSAIPTCVQTLVGALRHKLKGMGVL